MTEESLTARNRINQRNFRARRQNYIKELEERLRKYESEGIQATIEIQAAARQVTEQNVKLRLLLTQRFGMMDQEISNYLGVAHQTLSNDPSLYQQPSSAPNHQTSEQPRQHSANISRPSEPFHPDPSDHIDSALGLASLHNYPPPRISQAWSYQPHPVSTDYSDLSTPEIDTKSSSFDPENPTTCTDSPSESSNPSTPADNETDNSRSARCKRDPSTKCCGPTNIAPCITPSSSKPHVPTLIQAPDETTCEEAARIIASMRGSSGNPDDVLLELGCAKGDPICRIKNAKVFQLMDRG